jgi:hypothetical protein
MDTEDSLADGQPKSRKVWFVAGGIVLACFCLAALTAMVAGPAILSIFSSVSSGGGMYSGIASEQLKADVLNAIIQYESSANGCADVSLFLGQMIGSPDQTADGSWTEMWQVSACGASHLYSISFTPAAGGGTDFSVLPADQ